MKRFAIIFSTVVLLAYMVVSVVVLSRHGYLGTHYKLLPERMERVDSVINNAIAADDFPGAVLCVVRRALDGESMGNILYLKAYGNRQVCSGRDMASGKWIADTVAMTTDAIFDLASLSKCVGTTLAFMRTVENGQVRLTDNVSRYIPNFKPWESKPERKGDKVEREDITIKHLLTHTSGLPAGIHVPSFLRRFEKFGDVEDMNLRDSLVTYLASDAARLSRPGEVMRYSCLNFITLQAIIESVTNERLDDFARREVFEPMQLKNTWYNHIDSPKPYADDAKIVPTTVQEDGSLLCGEVHDPTARIVNRGVSGNAGLFSTAEDLAVVASMLMNGGVIRISKDDFQGRVGATERVRVFSQAVVDRFFRVPDEYAEHGRALGWDISSGYSASNGDLLTVGATPNHTGYTGTSMAIDLERGVAIILLTNRVHPIDDGAVARTRAVVSNIIMSALDK
ncbi:MAG: serine hydrolase [Alistipes sp.]|nr:serine hydrolase [Alistipes sp.]